MYICSMCIREPSNSMLERRLCTVGTCSGRLEHFGNRRWWEFCSKYSIPKPTRHAETILVVHEVVLEMVLLQLAVVERKAVIIVSGRSNGRSGELTFCDARSSVSYRSTRIQRCRHSRLLRLRANSRRSRYVQTSRRAWRARQTMSAA
jgi:hypothetical protein